ncbi:MAG: acetyl-CoA carboxylase biotin carboxyl carrier protein subunit [Ignavibacteria bacterium]|nr:acetyl-CoA carboxylase biotin carboxyl carrier protein subunit [Ignavibacteria bacterium]
MKKYYINLNNEAEQKLLTLISHNTVSYNDSEFEYEYKFIAPTIMTLRINNNNYIIKTEIDIDTEVKSIGFIAELNGNTYKIICKSELDLLLEKFSKTKTDKGFKKDVVSPMPGSIVKVNVKEGDRIKKGQVLLVLEAMKMENELKATKDCIVTKVLAEEKKPVDKGQILLKLEPVE